MLLDTFPFCSCRGACGVSTECHDRDILAEETVELSAGSRVSCNNEE